MSKLDWTLVQSMIWKFWSGPWSENICSVRVRVFRVQSFPCCSVRSMSGLNCSGSIEIIIYYFILYLSLAINIWKGSTGLNVSILPCRLKNLFDDIILGKFSKILSATLKFIGARGSSHSNLTDIPKWLLNHPLTSKRYSDWIMVPTFNLKTLRR